MNIIQRNNVHCLPAAAHDAPTLVYGHGFGCNKDMWSRVTPAFTPAYRQVLFDYVGSGESDASAFDPAPDVAVIADPAAYRALAREVLKRHA